MDVNRLSDAELMKRLRKHGVDTGPVTDTTREVYRRKLLNITQDGSRDRSSGLPSNRRKVEPSAPTLSNRVSNKYRGRPRSPQGGFGEVFKGVKDGVDEVAVKVTKMDINRLSDAELMKRLRKHGVDTGPVTDTTREVYRRKLFDITHDGSRDRSSGLPSNRRKVEPSAPTLPSRVSNKHRGRPRSPQGQGVESFVNNILSPGGSGGSSSRNPPSPFRSFHYQDSVEIGSEIEIVDDTSDGGMGQSPKPLAPPFPYQDNTTHYDWELLPSDVQICLRPNGSKWLLGKGGFGEVFKGVKDGVDEVAVKIIRIQQQAATIEQFKHEIDLISKLRHRHILQFYGACIKPTCLYMVTELMQGDLYTFLREDKQYMWSGAFGKKICVGIVTGIHYLHSRRPPIVHRDIKSPNILLMDGLAKIADVGLARAKMNSDITAQSGYTIAWAAPEVICRRRATEKIDIWSFGVILWEIVTGQPPHPYKLRIHESASQELRALYSNCTREDPDERPIAGDILVTLKDMQ